MMNTYLVLGHFQIKIFSNEICRRWVGGQHIFSYMTILFSTFSNYKVRPFYSTYELTITNSSKQIVQEDYLCHVIRNIHLQL